MKKIVATSIHFIALVLLIVSFIFLKFASTGVSLRSILAQPQYLYSEVYEAEIGEAVSDIFEYIDLRDLFEKNGMLNLNQVVAQADESGTQVSYNVSYLQSYAKSMGYFINSRNEIQYDERMAVISALEDEREHTIYVTFRAYMPEYQPASPSDGMTTLGGLAKEMLEQLAKYYRIRSKYFDNDSNLRFRVEYSNGSNSIVYSNDTSLASSDIENLGSYFAVDSESLYTVGNMRSLPSNIIPLLEARLPYADGTYNMSLGVDTNFPYEDQFSLSAMEYEGKRVQSLAGVILMIFSITAMLVSFVWLVASIIKDSREKVKLYPIDKISVELMILLLILWNYFADWLSPYIVESVRVLIGDVEEALFWQGVVSRALKYIMFIPAVLSIIKGYMAETLWKNSLIGRLIESSVHHINIVSEGTPRAYSILLFFLPNAVFIIVIALTFWGFLNYKNLFYLLLSFTILLVLLLIDFYTWHITTGLNRAVDRQVKAERMRTDLITNVSHDLKTPLTSIINYVDLIRRENIEDEKVRGYVEVLNQKSHRLKTLTEDLVEASKASSGNINMELTTLDMGEMIYQAIGEFEDKLNARELSVICNNTEDSLLITADGRHLWRVVENLLNNCCKYALVGSRVYIDLYKEGDKGVCTIKNISESPLNVSPDELTERFVRGDVSRTTEGSGLGLSITKSLTNLMKGEFQIEIDGDLYKASVRLPLVEQK